MKHLLLICGLFASVPAWAVTEVRSCILTAAAPYGIPASPVAPAKTVLGYVSNSSVGVGPYCKLLSAMSPTAFVQTTVNGGTSWVWQTIAGALAAVPPPAPPPVTTPPSTTAKYTLTWDPWAAPTYNVYAGTSAQTLQKVATNVTSPYTLLVPATGPNLCVGLTAVDSTGESAPSVWCAPPPSATSAPALTVH